ncbi:DUF421 domain-containing protein [Salinicoccus sp. HZC-1]|uniref:DUF421 domain-containing protein n=1 Tax=Salinicoccus sp. HZC-1 TaxID=3385497 RepID=UPI00398AB091
MLEFNRLIFSGFDVILRTLLMGIMAYAAIVIIVRISGKRSLSQLNAFDFIVTVAIGSILASVIINKNVTITQGITAFLVLIVLQFIISKLAVYSKQFSKYIKSEPVLLFYNNEFRYENMKKARVVENEIKQAIRSNGNGAMSDVRAVILETDGSISIINKKSGEDNIEKDASLFSGVKK